MEYNITKSELEMLQVLWQADAPLSRAEIIESSKNKTWKDSSIHILINGLLNKGLIYEAGFARSGKTFGRLFAPRIKPEEYYRSIFIDLPLHVRTNLIALLVEMNRAEEKRI